MNVIYTKRQNAGIAQLVERNLAKVEVASSNLVSRSSYERKPVLFIDLLLITDIQYDHTEVLGHRLYAVGSC